MTARFTIGAVADVQYCDIPNGSNWDGSRIRYYRGAKGLLEKSVAWWSEEKVDIVMNLADVIDAQCSHSSNSTKALKEVLDIFDRRLPGTPMYSMVGNHEYANFTHEELLRLPHLSDGLNYDFSPAKGWRVVVVNTYEHNVILADNRDYKDPLPTDPRYTKCLEKLLEHNPNLRGGEATWHKGVKWTEGLAPEVARFLPYNGMLGETQRGWLATKLAEARENGEKVIVSGHNPFLKGAAHATDLAIDCEEVLAVLQGHADVVKLVLSGHSHDGGFAVDAHGIGHVTLPSPLETAPEKEFCDAILKVFDDRIEIIGRGAATSQTVTFV